jgi:uncharacterized protein (DUF58 family)
MRWPFGKPRQPEAPALAAPAATAAVQRAPASGVPREVLRQVREIELRMRGLVDTIFGGEYQSVFRGQGMEFKEVREYAAGDDIRHIDWNVTARMGHPYVKKHVEERELTVLLLLDLSGSEQFGTRSRFKADAAAEVAAVLALSAVRNNDRVGLLIFTDRVEHVVPPRKGRRHVLRVIRDVLAFRPAGRGTDIAGALDYAARLLTHRSIIFVMSDFIAEGPPMASPGGRLEKTLRTVSQRHDLVAVRIGDHAEAALPGVGLLVLRDPESGQEFAIDTLRPRVRREFERSVESEQEETRKLFRRFGIDEIDIRTDATVARPLLAFFRRRERKLKR